MKFSRLNYTEPAVLRGIWVALVALLTACGLTVSDTVNSQAGSVIAAVGVVVPLAQALWTRSVVTPAIAPDPRVTDTDNPPPADVPQDDLPQTPGSVYGD